MTKRVLIGLIGLSSIGGYWAGVRALPALAQGMARCKVTVPQSWGDFIGVSDSYGLAFRDSSGTLRFVRQLPCGLESTPSVAIEAQRN